MTIQRNKLAAALKKRFSSPRALLRALGLDESLVDVGTKAPEVDDATKRLREFRTAFEQLLHVNKIDLTDGSVGKLLQLLDQYDIGTDAIADPVESFRKLLRAKGMSDADIETALEIARGNGEATADSLPLSGLRGGRGGAVSGQTRSPGERFAADASTDFDRRFPNAITLGADYSPDRGRFRSARWPDERRMAEYHKMFGGEHIAV